MSRFDDCLQVILQNEGGYSNIAGDKGGATKYGVTESVARMIGYRGEMRDFPLDLAARVYEREYWLPAKCDQITAPIDLLVFDAAVNCGVARSAKLLQEALGVVADGIIGPKTLQAIQQSDWRILAGKYLTARADYYRSIADDHPDQDKFLTGWLNRVEHLRKLVADYR